MARWVLGTYSDSDDRPIAEASRLVKYSTEIFRTDLQKRKATFNQDEELSEKGRTRRLAAEAAKSIATFRSAQARIRNDLNEARKETAEKRTSMKVDTESRFQIASWLRDMSMTDRNAILRDAAAGRMAGGDEIMAAVLSSFPRLLGYKDDHDPNFNMVRNEYLARVAPTETAEMADLELAEQAIQAAGDELEAFATDLVGETFTEMLADEEGRKTWNSMDSSEKSKAIADGGDIEELMKHGVEKTAEDYERDEISRKDAGEAEAFSRLSLKEKVEAVQQRTEWE